MAKTIITINKIPKGITFEDKMKYSVHLKRGKLNRNLGLFETKAQAERFLISARRGN